MSNRQRELEEIASELLDERPGLSLAAAVRLAAALLPRLDRCAADYERQRIIAAAIAELPPAPCIARAA